VGHLVVRRAAQPDQRLLRLRRRAFATQQHHRVVELGQPVTFLRGRGKALDRHIEIASLVGGHRRLGLFLRRLRSLGCCVSTQSGQGAGQRQCNDGLADRWGGKLRHGWLRSG
jgi:hypothetical protein